MNQELKKLAGECDGSARSSSGSSTVSGEVEESIKSLNGIFNITKTTQGILHITKTCINDFNFTFQVPQESALAYGQVASSS